MRRGGSTRSLQLDYKAAGGGGGGGDRGRERGRDSGRRTFQWEKNQTGEWERKRILEREEKRRNNGEGEDTRGDAGAQGHNEGSSSPVYEEYRESGRDPERGDDPEGLYDTLPPSRRAYDGYPASPPGINLHPAQLLPPLRAWDSQTGEGRGSQEERGGGPESGGPESGGPAGSGDELERLLNLVSLRARRATRVNRASTQSEPTADRGGV
ncbi:hypothetical protein EYF80_060490 [Liparis tanakae]|uniref:Uncharacterized protein n=1 Tax=Liparis tanakae TaxID=230148 RepID=A0A4Z2ELY7_9TELE|nr:hypothetical protein EYF80_060490 [Liparis tanakae]